MDKEAEKMESLPFPGEKMFNRLVHKVDLMSPARGSVIEAYRLAQQDMLEAGYRKLPKDKPLLLRGKTILEIARRGHQGCSGVPAYLEETVQAQRDSDWEWFKKHYEGK